MNNGQLPLGGGGGGQPPQQPQNLQNQLAELQQALQIQVRLAQAQQEAQALAQIQAQAHVQQAQLQAQPQLYQAALNQLLLQQQQQQPQLQNLLAGQQVLQPEQIANLVLLLRVQQQQQLQQEQERLMEQQRQRQQEQLQLEQQRQQQRLQMPQQNQQLDMLQQIQMQLLRDPHLLNRVHHPVAIHAPRAAHVPAAVPRPPPPRQMSPVQHAIDPAQAQAVNQVENFIIQEENIALHGQRPLHPQPVRPPQQAPVVHQHMPHVPLVRVNNLLVQPQVQHQQQQQQQRVQQIQQHQVPAPPPAPQVQMQPHVQHPIHQEQRVEAVPSPPPSPPAAPPPPPPPQPNRRGRGGHAGRRQRHEQPREEEAEDEDQQRQPEQPPRVDEALQYLRVIKQTFHRDVPIYHRFLEIMKEFRAQRIETPDVIEQVAELLYESPDLVLGFNTFLPVGYRINVDENNRYQFTSPHNESKTLLSPGERRAQREAEAQRLARENNEAEEEGEPRSEEENDDLMEEEDAGGADLIEEVIPDNNVEAPVEDVQSQDTSEDTLKVIQLLQNCFNARPGKLSDFTTFMNIFIALQKFHTEMARSNYEGINVENPEEALEDDSNTPGPAPPPPAPVDENMEVEEVEGQEGKENEPEEPRKIYTEQERLESISSEQDEIVISVAAKLCLGEPDLLAALIDFLPYFKKLLQNGSDQVMQKIKTIIDFKPTNSVPIDIKMADKELAEAMENANMGTNKNEKLVIRKSDEPGNNDEILVLEKSYRILYDNLKKRTTKTQISHLVVLLNMYLNLDLSKQELVTEVPRIMGREGSEVESLIRNLLGMNRDPKDLPENDVDAVMRKDMPPIRARRGLRVQKLIPQMKTSDVATVCTLGPSYRLMKDPKEGECFGRIEMADDIKGALNDKWSSWPSYSSEDTGTQQNKKSNLEEFHFRTEDERYELDIIVDSNRTVMEELDMTLRKYNAMSDAEQKAFVLDAGLNCSSRATFLRVMNKIYTSSTPDFILAAQKNPSAGLRKIIEGLQEKDTQWTRFQQDANRTWRDALDKHLGTSTVLLTNQQKNYDQKAVKSKSLVNAIEQVFEERKKNNDEGNRPHMTLEYTPDGKVYQDVNDVIHHFFHELPGGKNDGDRSKLVLFTVLMEWLCQQQENSSINEIVEKAFMSEKEQDEKEPAEIGHTQSEDASSSTEGPSNAAEKFRRTLFNRDRRVFYGDDAVYLVIRYHHMIQDRFAKLLASQSVFSEEYKQSQKKQEQWQAGIGAQSNARAVLEKYIVERRAAVEDIKNIRHCPATYYNTTLRELKQLGSAQTDLGAFEDTVKHLFPGDACLFSNIDKLFNSLAKNIHHASCAEEKENPISLYLKYRKRLIETEGKAEREAVEQEYAQVAEEVLRGKNTYRFEFVDEKSAPFINIWVIPREEKESEVDDDDEDGNEGGNDDKDDNNDKNDEDKDEEMPPTNEDNDDNEEEEEEDASEDGSPSGAEGTEEPGDEEMGEEMKDEEEFKSIPKTLLSQIKNCSQKKNRNSRGIEKISKSRIIRAKSFMQPIRPIVYA